MGNDLEREGDSGDTRDWRWGICLGRFYSKLDTRVDRVCHGITQSRGVIGIEKQRTACDKCSLRRSVPISKNNQAYDCRNRRDQTMGAA
jgi:hypothetical protein